MDVLSELITACRAADTETMTTRHSAIEKISRQLMNSGVIRALDSNSDRARRDGSRGVFTWHMVFKVARGVVLKEGETIRKYKEAPTKATVTSREKKRSGVNQFIRRVVQVADKRGPRLKINELMSHILEILKDEFLCQQFGADHSAILLKYILPVRKYWASISQDLWRELLERHVQFLKDPPPHFERALLARVIHAVVQGGVQQCDFRGNNLLPMLEEYFTNIRTERNMPVLENMMGTLNAVCWSLAVNGRVQVCRIGESISTMLIYLMANKPSETLKDHVVEFLRLQICVHHPHGMLTEREGAFAVDWDTWKGILRKIYDAIYNDLHELGGRNKFAKGASIVFRGISNVRLKDTFIELAADVCHQVFATHSTSLDVTQISLETQVPGSAAKRRRIESGWGALRDVITSTGQVPAVIPWLQLLRRIVEKYPSSVPVGEFFSLATTLHMIQADCRNIDVLKYLLPCIDVLAVSQSCQKCDMDDGTWQHCSSIWEKIWAATLRSLSLHHAEDEGFALLSCFIKCRLIEPSNDVWTLFLPGITVSSSSAPVHFLANYLHHLDLPETYRPSVLTVMNQTSETGHYPLRNQLLGWLVPNSQEVEGSAKVLTNHDATVMAEVLVVLTLRDTHSINLPASCDKSVSDHWSELAETYLQTSYDVLLNRNVSETDKLRLKEQTHSSCLTAVQEQLNTLLKSQSSQLLETLENDLSTLEHMASWCNLLLKIVHGYLYHEVVKTNGIMRHPLVETIKALLKRFASLFADLVRKEAAPMLGTLLGLLQDIFTIPDSPYSHQMADVCRSVTPDKLLSQLLLISQEKVPSLLSKLSSTQSRPSLTQAPSNISDLDLDLDDDMSVGSNGTVEMDDMMEEDNTDVTNAAASSAEGKGVVSLLCSKSLSDGHRLRQRAVTVLCRWCCHSRGTSEIPHGASEYDVQRVKKEILELLDEEIWDESRASDIQLLLTMVEGLSTPDQFLEVEEIGKLLDAFRSLCRLHRKDQEVCERVLLLLASIVPHLAGSQGEGMVSEALQDMRIDALHFLGIFWDMCLKYQVVGHVRRAIAECTYTFIKHDLQGLWTKWQSKGGQDDGGRADRALADEFPKLLKDKDQQIRLTVAKNISVLFEKTSPDGKIIARDKLDQGEMFDSIYSILKESMSISGRYSHDESKDAVINRTASMLHTLATVATISPVCEKQAIFGICQMAKDYNLENTGIVKILDQLSSSLSYLSLKDYMNSHLPFLVHSWLKEGYAINEFAYQLAGYRTLKDFYGENLDVVIPFLLMRKSMMLIEGVARTVSMELIPMLSACLPHIMIHILPWFAVSKSGAHATGDGVPRKITLANTCYELLTNTISHQEIEKSICLHLAEIVVNILKALHEEGSEAGDTARFCDPEPNPPYYDKATITLTLDYLTHGHGPNIKSLISLLSKIPDGIQQVLLALRTHMSRQHRVHEKQRTLLMYRLFVGLILQEFAGQLGGCWAFVLRDVIFTLIHTINALHQRTRSKQGSQETKLLVMCVEQLQEMCETAVDICPQELARFLSTIVGTLVPLIDSAGNVSVQCGQLLDYLVVENAAKLESAICLLDPLPRTPPSAFASAHTVIQRVKYQGRSFSLLQEIGHFVQAANQSSAIAGTSRLHGLHFLRQQLATRKEELAHITASFEIDEGSDHLLVKFIQELLQLAKSANREVALEASCCLGEIGPIDLPAIAIKPSPHSPALSAALESVGDMKGTELSIYRRNCHIFHLLNEYLMDSSVKVVTAASDVLKRILATQGGYEFASQYKQLAHDHLLQYVHTFRTSKNKLVSLEEKTCSVEDFVRTVGDVTLWVPMSHSDHDRWIKQLTCAFIESGAIKDEVLCLLAPVCNTKTEFCEVILPYLIHDILLHMADAPEYRSVLSERIHHFFDMHCDLNEEHASRPTTPMNVEKVDGSISMNLASVKVMLSVAQYLRLQERSVASRGQPDGGQTTWNNNFWLDLDYLQLAKAAQNCSAHFTTLLYAEIWCDVQRSQSSTSTGSQSGRRSTAASQSLESVEEEFSQRSQLDKLSNLSGSTDINVQSLMLEAYRNLGDPDGVYGCGAGQLADTQARTRTYEHENNWAKALSCYDLEMSEPATSSVQVGLLQALQKFGLSHVLDTYLQGLSHQGLDRVQDIQDFQYKMAWQNANWNLDVPSRFDGGCGYNKAVYSALWGIKMRDPPMATIALTHARNHALETLVQSNQESVRSLYPALSNLVCLSQISDLADAAFGNDGHLTLDQMSEKWTSQDKLMCNDFDLIEPILQQRSLLMGINANAKNAADNPQLIERLEEVARSARLAGRHQVAERAIHSLHQLDVSNSCLSWRLEEAQIFWYRKEQNVAKNLMKDLVSKLKQLQEQRPELSQLYAQCLGIYGSWLAKTHSENPSVVIDDYLRKAVNILDSINCGESDVALDAFLSLARFADLQYQSIVDYMKSSTFEAKQALAKRAREDAEELRGLGEKSSRYLRILEKQCAIDEEELAATEEDKTQYLECAVMHYLRCLAGGDKHDLRVFRLTSLWYENALVNAAINKHIKDSLPRIKSHKFLPLMYQLAARMSTSPSHRNDLFQPTLIQLIERVVTDHPHHTIHIILALANAYKDDEILQKVKTPAARGGRLSRGNTQDSQQEEDRVQAAKAMISRLKKSKRAEIITDTEKLCVAYIQLANWNVDQYKRETKALPLPNSQPIKQMKRLVNVAMPTAGMKVDPSCRYEDILYVEGFQPTFKLAGGINLPKIITCVGSDGVQRRQLVKGKDDLRQDAVMQQVFQMVNNLLKKDSEARQRQLKVRTYKVIPLSQRSGLLEWCEGTIPLGDYLIGQKGAHVRYRPRDLKAHECRAELAGAHDPKSTRSKYQTFMRVCQRFQPVFRHFFMEKFPDPAHWYECRLAYTRSVATNSIVGYILGLGDRHVQNILIDCETAEFIHIDLGVAFEQGRILPTPETVPFRLTRDIVDGMGVTGVEGVFRRCSEKTMEVMHASQEALLTILQVLLYDPLYAWTISPLKAYALQQRRDARAAADPNCTDANTTHADIFDIERTSSSSNREPVENVNKVAERVLLRLQQKLRGVELGVQLSVSGQVNHLIQEARDPKNLCRLFPGWQPYI